MSAKHTPGPWKAIAVDWTPNGNARFEIEGIHRTGIADAQLIAAAPDLLYALEEALHLIETLTPLEGSTVRMVRAAIAKATGETR